MVKVGVAGSDEVEIGTGSLVSSESKEVIERGERLWRFIVVDGDGGSVERRNYKWNLSILERRLLWIVLEKDELEVGCQRWKGQCSRKE